MQTGLCEPNPGGLHHPHLQVSRCTDGVVLASTQPELEHQALKALPLPCRRERSKVPYIVRQCVEEIERRGMEEVGIYRVSGVATDIQALKAAFDVSECQPGQRGLGVWMW